MIPTTPTTRITITSFAATARRSVEFDNEKLDELENEISRKLGFSVKSQRLHITGACEQMKKSGSCKNKACDHTT